VDPAPDRDEHIRIEPVPLTEAYRMIDRGEITDAGTLIVLFRFRGIGEPA